MQKPGIPAQQMQRTRERLAGAERGKTHSRSTRNTPRKLVASRGEAADMQR